MYRMGVDIGGTFTDFALFDARGAKMSVHKRLTTPHDPSEAVTEGIDALLKRDGVAIADIRDVVHGTTLVPVSTHSRTLPSSCSIGTPRSSKRR